MTEAEWLATPTPEPMLDLLRGKVSDPAAAVCCGVLAAIRHLYSDKNAWKAVEFASAWQIAWPP